MRLDDEQIKTVARVLKRAGYDANEPLIRQLWYGFSLQRESTNLLVVSDKSLVKFLDWIESGMTPEKAWS